MTRKVIPSQKVRLWIVFHVNNKPVLGKTDLSVIVSKEGSTVASLELVDDGTGCYEIYWDIPEDSIEGDSFKVSCYEDGIILDSEELEVETVKVDIIEALQPIIEYQQGSWEIKNNQMLFYGLDNVTVIATYDLTDMAGNPAMSEVFKRNKV